jgi:hypothetical protein
MAMNPRLLRPTIAGGFDPKSLGGLAWWLDAADESKVSLNGTAVSQWDDKSGNGRNAVQSTPGSQPSYANSQNGRKVITFDASDDRLATSAAISLGTGGYTVFAVAYWVDGFKVLLEGAGLNPYMSVLPDPPYDGFRHFDGSSAADTPGGVINNNEWFLVEFVVSSASRLILVNGTQQASASGTTRTASLQTIGATTAGGFFWDGRVAEILVYDTARNASDRSMVRAYLGKKWGVTVA